MLSSLGNKTKRIIMLALSALLLCALPAFAAEKIELWNGDIRKGSVSVRMNGTLREMAVDERWTKSSPRSASRRRTTAPRSSSRWAAKR